MENLSYDTIIIGAGLAGISAARTLIQNGVQDVLVLEGNGHFPLESNPCVSSALKKFILFSSRTSWRSSPNGIYTEFSFRLRCTIHTRRGW